MRTLNNHLWQLFWSWIQGKSFYKLSQIEGMDKRDVKALCEARIPKAFHTELTKRREWQQFRKLIRYSFPDLQSYQKFYEFNKKRK